MLQGKFNETSRCCTPRNGFQLVTCALKMAMPVGASPRRFMQMLLLQISPCSHTAFACQVNASQNNSVMRHSRPGTSFRCCIFRSEIAQHKTAGHFIRQ
jgi:hypothetical protein